MEARCGLRPEAKAAMVESSFKVLPGFNKVRRFGPTATISAGGNPNP
jgi:hypothetical protein